MSSAAIPSFRSTAVAVASYDNPDSKEQSAATTKLLTRVKVLNFPDFFPNDVFRIILAYNNSSHVMNAIRCVDFQYNTLVDRAEIVAWRDSLRGGSDFITRVASNLEPKKYQSQIDSLHRLAAHCQSLETFDSNLPQIDSVSMLNHISANAVWLRNSLIDALGTIEQVAFLSLERLSNANWEANNQGTFLKNWISIVFRKDFYKMNPILLAAMDMEIAMQWMRSRPANDLQFQDQFEMIDPKAMDPELVLKYANEAPIQMLSEHRRIELLGQIIVRHLEMGNACAWDWLKPRTASPAVTAEEIENANQIVELATTFINAGHLPDAMELIKANGLTDEDPKTQTLKFPDQCVKLLGLLIARPKIDQKTLGEILHFILHYLPDDKTKLGLLEEMEKVIKKSTRGRPPILEIVWAATGEIRARPLRLYKLSRILIADGDLERAFLIGRTFKDCAPLNFSFLDGLLERSDLSAEEKAEFLRLAQNLPKELKHFLIIRAIEKRRQDLAAGIEKNFDRAALYKEATANIRPVLMTERIIDTILAKEHLDRNDILNLLHTTLDIHASADHRRKILSRIEKSKNPDLEEAQGFLKKYEEIKKTLRHSNGKITTDEMMKEASLLPLSLQVSLIYVAEEKLHIAKRDHFKDLIPFLESSIAALKKSIEALEKNGLANTLQHFRYMTEFHPHNPFISIQEQEKVLNSDFRVAHQIHSVLYNLTQPVVTPIEGGGTLSTFEMSDLFTGTKLFDRIFSGEYLFDKYYRSIIHSYNDQGITVR